VTGRVQVTGADTFARTLRAFGDELVHLDVAAAAAGDQVAALAAARARRRTGALAASFGALVTDAGVQIGSPLRYAGVQEFGWARHGITPSLALTSALADSAPAVQRIYTDAVDTALGKVRGAA